MFDGFEVRKIAVSGVEINLRIGGAGAPLLLLHGYPQSHVMWHKLAPRLAERYTVVAAEPPADAMQLGAAQGAGDRLPIGDPSRSSGRVRFR